MNGLYIGSMGMMSSQLKINTHANNISNANTNGYKFDTMISEVFEHKDTYRAAGQKTFIGDYQNKVMEVGKSIDLKTGNYQITNSDLNVVIKDEVPGETSFFVVAGEQGSLLTRNGDFQINEERNLKTHTGEFVLDANGNRITIPVDVKISFGKSGEIFDVESGSLVAQLQKRVITDENKYLLDKRPAAMFALDGMEINELPQSNALVESSMLEGSNVDMTNEMVEMLNAQRRFQASQKIMTSFDKIYEKEANDLL